ncbi:MAG: lipopolysaccharide heptosyltransferase II [Acidobacteria bacterium]|nr:lipopolysaccharide heptosyltransferase II [Acidobacteriota bacterium]
MAKSIENILVRGTNWVGDSIITIAALRELRRIFPQARISLLVKPWVSGIFEDLECVNEVIKYEKESLIKKIKNLQKKNFDLVVLFQNAFEAAVIAFGSRAEFRVGFPTEFRGFLLTHPLNLSTKILSLHQIYYYLHIVSQMEEGLFGKSQVDFQNLNYQLPVREERKISIKEKLKEFSIDTSKKLVAINPGATNSRAKRWPLDRFAELADRLVIAGVEVVFIGAATELDITEAIIKKMEQRAKILTGKTSLSESIAFLSICDALISNDTGPAYISAALDRPTLTIFGPTDDKMIHPFGKQAEIIRNKVDCSPCMLRDCPIDHRCMTQISVQMVLLRTLTILGYIA